MIHTFPALLSFCTRWHTGLDVSGGCDGLSQSEACIGDVLQDFGKILLL